MSASGKSITLVTLHIKKLRGGSQPILVRASDDRLYVVKFTNNLQGANLSFNESVGSDLYHSCGMAVPSWKQLLITDAFLDRNPDCWMETPEGRLRPASGLCFASRYMGGEGKCLLEVIPGTKFTRIRNSESFWLAWMIDICAAHTDNRQAIFLEDSRSRLDAFFVDHGHLFGGPNGVDRPHFLASRYLDPRIYQSLSPEQRADLPWVMKHVDVDQLWLRVQALPADWITASAVAGFEQCLSRLSSARLLQNVIDTMADAQRTYVTAHNEPAGNRKPPLAAMPQGMPGAGFGHRQVRGQIDRSVCA